MTNQGAAYVPRSVKYAPRAGQVFDIPLCLAQLVYEAFRVGSIAAQFCKVFAWNKKKR